MIELAPDFPTVVQAFGTAINDPNAQVKTVESAEARHGLSGTEIDELFVVLRKFISPDASHDSMRRDMQLELYERWGEHTALITFSNSQLRPRLGSNNPDHAVRRRATRLDMGRALCDFVFPGQRTVYESITEVVAGRPLPALVRGIAAYKNALQTVRNAENVKAVRQAARREIAESRSNGLTEMVVSRIALSELSPGWVAKQKRPSLSEEYVAYVKLLQQSRSIAQLYYSGGNPI